MGAGLRAGLGMTGRGLRAAYEAVDPDVRGDLGRMPLVGLSSLGPRHAAVRPKSDDGHRPVVCVHGLGGHRGNFRMMRAWLALQGHRRTYAMGLPADQPLRELGRHLARYIEEVIEVNQLDDDVQLDLVAHSMGGLVCRLALLEVELAQRIHTLVTLGTPHTGTQAARFAGSGRARELRPDSEALDRLAGQLPWHGTVRLVCLWSEADPLMQPAHTARVEGAVNRELTGLTHTQYLLDRRAFGAVLGALHDS